MSSVTLYIESDLEELIPGFMQNREKDVRDLRIALANNDMDEVALLGHSLKGVGGGYGFDFVTEMGREIEEASKTGQNVLVEQLIEQLATMLDNITIIYR